MFSVKICRMICVNWGLRNIDYQDNLLMLIKQKIHILPQFLHSRQTDPDPEDCSADSDVAAQRSEDG